jgi:hypothetical protein
MGFTLSRKIHFRPALQQSKISLYPCFLFARLDPFNSISAASASLPVGNDSAFSNTTGRRVDVSSQCAGLVLGDSAFGIVGMANVVTATGTTQQVDMECLRVNF